MSLMRPLGTDSPMVICLCACSLKHPEKSGICNARQPVAMISLPDQVVRIPICEPCARATGVPLMNDDAEGEQ